EAKIGGQPFRDGFPRLAVVVAAQDPDVGPWPPWPAPIGPATVVLHVEPSRRGWVAGALVDALTELGIRIAREPRADALVRRLGVLASIRAEVVRGRGDTEVQPIPSAQDRVHAEPSVPRLPLSSLLMIADARNHLPGISTVARPEERCWLRAAQ